MTDQPSDTAAGGEELSEAELRAREQALIARIRASRARIDHLAALVEFTRARWPFVEAEERRRDPGATDDAISARVKDRVEAELRERGLDDQPSEQLPS